MPPLGWATHPLAQAAGAAPRELCGTLLERGPCACCYDAAIELNTLQVQVVVGDDEPQDNAMKRFRREVMSAGGWWVHALAACRRGASCVSSAPSCCTRSCASLPCARCALHE